MNADVSINIIQTDKLVYPKFIENAGWKTALWNYRTYNTYGPPQVVEANWVPNTGSMISILHNSKAYIGWELEGNFVYDYTKEYTLTYTTSTNKQGHMNIEDEGDTFANDVLVAKQALGYTNLSEFDVKARFGFTYFEKREVIKIYSGSEVFYLFNHADLNMPTMNEISFIRNLFESRTPCCH